MNGEKEPYIVVKGDGITDLMDRVKLWMGKGYVVTGGVCNTETQAYSIKDSFYQAMVLVPPEPEDFAKFMFQLRYACSLDTDGNIIEADRDMLKEMFPELTREWN